MEPIIHRGGSILNDTTIVDKTVIEYPVLDKTVIDNASPVVSPSITPADPKDICKFFLKGCCKHGFKGTTEKDGVAKCKFQHPALCKRYMDFGDSPSGCSKGTNCERTHATLCLESAEHKVCSSSVAGKRCKFGYHIKGTKSLNPDSPLPAEGRTRIPKEVDKQKVKNSTPNVKESTTNKINDNNENVEANSSVDNDVVKTFLVSVVKLLSGLKSAKKVKVKEKQDPNQELIQSLASLLN